MTDPTICWNTQPSIKQQREFVTKYYHWLHQAHIRSSHIHFLLPLVDLTKVVQHFLFVVQTAREERYNEFSRHFRNKYDSDDYLDLLYERLEYKYPNVLTEPEEEEQFSTTELHPESVWQQIGYY